jgi:hypothetical protein
MLHTVTELRELPWPGANAQDLGCNFAALEVWCYLLYQMEYQQGDLEMIYEASLLLNSNTHISMLYDL